MTDKKIGDQVSGMKKEEMRMFIASQKSMGPSLSHVKAPLRPKGTRLKNLSSQKDQEGAVFLAQGWALAGEFL